MESPCHIYNVPAWNDPNDADSLIPLILLKLETPRV